MTPQATPQATPRGLTPRGSSLMTPRSRNRMLGTRHQSMMGLSTMTSSPKWSLMGKRAASVGKRNEARPDPGAYAHMDPSVTSRMSKSPKANFGSLATGRLTSEKSQIPGPGSYNPIQEGTTANSTSRCALIYSGPSREQRPQGRSRESTPDPGHYGVHNVTNTSKMSRTPSYGFASSRADRFPQLKDRAPGPGSYQQKEVLAVDASGKFLGSPRNRERRAVESPDPGHYLQRDPSHTSKMPSSPRAGFGSLDTGRLNLAKEGTPGPGSYAHREVMNEQTTSFGNSERMKGLKPRTESPDPGHYSPVDPTSTSKMARQGGYGWGTSDTGRFYGEEGAKIAATNGSPRLGSPKSPRSNTPGPGSYNVVEYNGSQNGGNVRGFGGTASRPSLAQHTRAALSTPGPGTYVKGTLLGETGPKFSMGSRQGEKMKSTPGPGEYGGHWTQFD